MSCCFFPSFAAGVCCLLKTQIDSNGTGLLFWLRVLIGRHTDVRRMFNERRSGEMSEVPYTKLGKRAQFRDVNELHQQGFISLSLLSCTFSTLNPLIFGKKKAKRIFRHVKYTEYNDRLSYEELHEIYLMFVQ